MNTQKAILEASKKPDRKLTLVDNRGLAKPNNYDGSADFLAVERSDLKRLWSQSMTTLGKLWLGRKMKPIQSAPLQCPAEFGDVNPAQETIPDLEAKDAQLYAVPSDALREGSVHAG